jgi:hypothetical protein
MTDLQFSILMMTIWVVGSAQAQGQKTVLGLGAIAWMIITFIMWVKG